jgi:hypothetical protein
MAAPNFTPIQLYYSSTAAAEPSAGDLANGELAINITDGKLFYKNISGVVTLLASAAGSTGDVVGPASATNNNLAAFDGVTGKLIKQAGTVTVGQGGTGQSTYTDGQLLIGNSTGNTLTKTTLTASTGISVTNGTGSITIANTAPDQTVVLTGAGATTTSGTYPNFTISSVNTTYGTATTTTDGLIKLGDGTVQTTAANTVSADASRTYAIQLNGSGQAVVNVPWSSGSGTITSVGASAPITSTGGTAPTIGLGVVPVANGGTNLTSYNANGVLYASSASVLASGTTFTYDPTTNLITNNRTPSIYPWAAGWSQYASGAFTAAATASSGSATTFLANNLIETSGTYRLGPANNYGNALVLSNGNFLVYASNTFSAGQPLVGVKQLILANPTGDITFNTSGSPGTLTNNGTTTLSSTVTLSGLTASTALALNASKNIVSVTNTGSGDNVLATSPTLVTPNLGTPASGTMTNVTGLPIDGGTTGTLPVARGGTGTTTSTGTGSTVLSTSPTLFGTPIAPTAAAGTNTTQIATTAFVQTAIGSTGATGTRGQAFTSNGTFTIPTGVTALKVTVVGGGGGGSGSGTGSGGTGGTSQVASGTQSITTISATGGVGGYNGGSVGLGGSGGVGSNGTLNIGGQGGGSISLYGGGATAGPAAGGSSILGGGGSTTAPSSVDGQAGRSYGGGGSSWADTFGTATHLGGGGGGGAAISFLTSLTPGGTLSVTVGAAGTAGTLSGYAGAAGVVIFEW